MILRVVAHSHALLYREEVAGALTTKGFTEYNPAQNSITNQAWAFQRARGIVTTHGVP